MNWPSKILQKPALSEHFSSLAASPPRSCWRMNYRLQTRLTWKTTTPHTHTSIRHFNGHLSMANWSWLFNIWRRLKVHKLHIVLQGRLSSELWDVTCHMGSHSVTCWHMVKQFVKLFAIQYGLTFCLYVLTLWSTITLSFQTKYQSAKWYLNLLRHWQSSLIT